MSNFSKKAGITNNEDIKDKEVVDWKRDSSDNTIFPEIQIKDISTLIDENTVGKWDFDTPIYKVCSNMETKYIVVQHKTEEVSVELKGIREFKGQTKVISEVSWLGVENIKRKIQGLPEWVVEDFEVVSKSSLVHEHAEALKQAKIQVQGMIKSVRMQYGLNKIDMIMGEGDNFRHLLPTCKPYKGNRADTLRPILLKEIRQWAVKEMGAEMAVARYDGEMVEADDLVEYYASEGYRSYSKTGIFKYVCIASDKDAMGNPKLLINPDKHTGKDNPKKGQWKLPQAMLIGSTAVGSGGIDLIQKGSKKEIKGYGLKWIVYQALLGEDSADNYSALKHLGRKFNYGEVAAYEDLVSLLTPKDVLQKAVDVFAGLLPYGVQYTTHDNVELDVDTMTYMNTYFLVAYMMRSTNDTMDFYKLCSAFKVDTSKLVNNNTMTAPKLTFNKETSENNVDILKEMCESNLSEIGTYKSLKKGDLVEKLDLLKASLESQLEQFDKFYALKQEEK